MAGSGSSEVRTSIFSGENYEFWRIKMLKKGVTISDSKKKTAEGSAEEEDDEKTVAEYMRDAKALGIIQNAVSDQIFPRIANADTAKMAWDLLYGEYHGGDQVRSVKLQNLRREFEYTRMRDDETLSGYLTRLNELINQMKTFGEVLSNERLVQKVLISLSKPYDPICLVIENTKCIDKVDLQEVLAILKSQEQRFDMHTVDATDKAFGSFSVNPKGQQQRGNSQSSESKKNWNGKGKKWDSKPQSQQRSFANPAQNSTSAGSMKQDAVKPQCKVCSKFHFGECRYKGQSKCHNCDRFGHWARECTAGKVVQKANCANQAEVTGNLFYANSAITEVKVNGNWYIDSGCSNHMTGNAELLIDVRTNVTGKVQMPTGNLVDVAGIGSLMIDTNSGRKCIKEVMFLPSLKENLLSVGQMDEHGYYLLFGGRECCIFDGPSLDCLIIKVKMKNNRCYPLSLMQTDQIALKASVTECTWIWHKRLGHLNLRSLKQLRENEMVPGLPHLEDVNGVCAGCQMGKQHRDWFPKGQAWRAKNPLELVHTDLCGPMQNESIAGNKYFMLLIDDHTRMSWVYFLRHKSEALICFIKFKAMVELQCGFKVKCLRSDRGGEFLSTEFSKLLESEGMQRQLSIAYTPQQNGVVERKNRTVVEMAKAMLHDKSMPYFLWAEAVHTAVYILNRSPAKALHNITPFEAYSGRKPGIGHLKVFGSLCYVHVPPERRQKLDAKSVKGVFVGYATCEKGYRVFDPSTKKLILSRDVIFYETKSWNWKETSENSVAVTYIPNQPPYDHTPLKWRNINDILAQCNLCIVEPEKYEEAAQDKAWIKAMEEELSMIEKNETWELVDRPSDKQVIGVKWVFKTKLNLDGSVQKNKARLVAKGYVQKPGVDYNETFAPEEVYVDQLEGFVINGKEDKVYKLYKALYGLKQAPRPWYGEIDSYFAKCGFEKSLSEATLYTKTRGENDILIVSIYVDDIVYTGNNQDMLDEFKEDMKEKYEMSDLGLLHHFLGMGVIQTESSIFIHQKKYASSLLDKFGLKECKSVSIPLVATEKLSKEDGSGAANEEKYRKLVGSLLYLTATRPDVMYAASLLARYMHGPSNKHYGIAKRVLRYIKGTLDYGLHYMKGKKAVLVGFYDSDWGGSLDDSKSTSGYAFSFGSGVFSWASMKQNCVSLSTAEAEYISAAEATTQAIWLRFVLEDFGELQAEATPLQCDNTSAISITKNPVFHQRTKHIDRRYHFIKNALQQGFVDLVYCPTKEQVADIFTKALPKERFNYLIDKLGVVSAQSLKGSISV
ncbi:unnamed protein product [Prunus armeniaca]